MLKTTRIVPGLGLLLLCLAVAMPIHAQMADQVLPGSYTAAMVTGFPYIAAAPLFPPHDYVANVYYHVDKIGNTYTYFYKIEHISGDSIRAVSVNIAPNVVNFDAGLGLYKFGAFKPSDTTSILVADTILGPNTKPLRWSSCAPCTNLFQTTTYLWIESDYPAFMANLGVIDGIATNTNVPAPAPEPLTFALAGIGLAAIAGARKRINSK